MRPIFKPSARLRGSNLALGQDEDLFAAGAKHTATVVDLL